MVEARHFHSNQEVLSTPKQLHFPLLPEPYPVQHPMGNLASTIEYSSVQLKTP